MTSPRTLRPRSRPVPDGSSRRFRSRARIGLLAVAAFSIGATGALAAPFGAGLQPASADPIATYDVTSNADDGSPGTLRWAMTQANASVGEDLITIGAVGTIELGSPLPATTESVAIQGPGIDAATIDGRGNRIFQMSAPQGSTRFLDVSDLTITGAPWIEGSVLSKVHGNASFDGVSFTGNLGIPAIRNWEGGILTIRDSEFTGNTGIMVLSDHGNTPSSTVADSGYSNRTYISGTSFTGTVGVACVVRTERFLEMVDTTITDNEGDGLCVRGLNRSYVRSTTIARNGGDGIQLHSWGSSTVFQNAIAIDDVLVHDNDKAGVTGTFFGSGVPRPADELLVSDSVVFGNLDGDVTGDVYPSNPTNLVDNVIGIPRPPRDVTGVAVDGGVDVSWQAPSFDSGSPVTHSTVTASPGGATCTSTTNSCVVLGLTNGTPYTFRAVATNARGDSWLSAASAPVTPDPTTAPTTTAPTTTAPTTTAPGPTTTAPTTTAPAPTTTAPAPTTTAPSVHAPTTVVPPPVAPTVPSEPTAAELAVLPMGLDVPATVRPGQTITVTGTGFVPGETVQVVLGPQPVVLTEVLADGDGIAVARVTIPLAASAGEHHLYMYGTTSRTGVGGPTEVLGAAALADRDAARPAALAFTGAAAGPLVAVGLLLAALGMSLQFRNPRRRTR